MIAKNFDLVEAQHNIHTLIDQQAALDHILDAIARWFGILHPSAISAFMRFDPVHCTLSLFPSDRFSQYYIECLQCIPVGPNMGAAAYYQRLKVTEYIHTDPCWRNFRQEALKENLRACWSQPVITPQGELLGTFDAYYRHSFAPTEFNKQQLRQAAALVALALVRDRESQQFLTLSEWHRSLSEYHPDGGCDSYRNGHFLRPVISSWQEP